MLETLSTGAWKSSDLRLFYTAVSQHRSKDIWTTVTEKYKLCIVQLLGGGDLEVVYVGFVNDKEYNEHDTGNW